MGSHGRQHVLVECFFFLNSASSVATLFVFCRYQQVCHHPHHMWPREMCTCADWLHLQLWSRVQTQRTADQLHWYATMRKRWKWSNVGAVVMSGKGNAQIFYNWGPSSSVHPPLCTSKSLAPNITQKPWEMTRARMKGIPFFYVDLFHDAWQQHTKDPKGCHCTVISDLNVKGLGRSLCLASDGPRPTTEQWLYSRRGPKVWTWKSIHPSSTAYPIRGGGGDWSLSQHLQAKAMDILDKSPVHCRADI